MAKKPPPFSTVDHDRRPGRVRIGRLSHVVTPFHPPVVTS